MDEISSVTHVGSWVDHGIMTSVVSAIKRHIKGKKLAQEKERRKVELRIVGIVMVVKFAK